MDSFTVLPADGVGGPRRVRGKGKKMARAAEGKEGWGQLRLERIQARLDSDELLALAAGDDFRYAAGWTPVGDERPTFLLIGRQRVGLIIASVNREEAVSRLGTEMAVVSFSDADDPAGVLKTELGRFSGYRRILLSDAARYDHASLLAAVSGQQLGLASRLMVPLRLQKDAEEQSLLAHSQAINDRAMRAAWDALDPAMTELELADVVRRAYGANGADSAAFIMVAAGAHSALPHHVAGDTRLGHGPVLLDIGCYYQGYASDMTRVAYLGEPTPKFRQIHALVDLAVSAALARIGPGVAAADVDLAARGVIVRGGYGSAFVHRLGHGIGLGVHEAPSVTETNPDPLPEQAAFSVEPGIYLPGEFGVRLEEVVINRKPGPLVLSSLSREIFVKAMA